MIESAPRPPKCVGLHTNMPRCFPLHISDALCFFNPVSQRTTYGLMTVPLDTLILNRTPRSLFTNRFAAPLSRPSPPPPTPIRNVTKPVRRAALQLDQKTDVDRSTYFGELYESGRQHDVDPPSGVQHISLTAAAPHVRTSVRAHTAIWADGARVGTVVTVVVRSCLSGSADRTHARTHMSVDVLEKAAHCTGRPNGYSAAN